MTRYKALPASLLLALAATPAVAGEPVTVDSGGSCRIRPTPEGSAGPLVGGSLTPALAGDRAGIVEAFVDVGFDPPCTLRVRKSKGPVGLERLQSGNALAMVERACSTELARNRDLGVQLQGEPDVDAFPPFADPAATASHARSWGLGLNWYLTSNLRLATDYLRTVFDGGAANADRDDGEILLSRLQVAFR